MNRFTWSARMWRRGLGLGLLLALGWVAGPGPASAHHSSAQYDTGRPIVLTGTLKAFRWVNPHAVMLVEVRDPKGGVQLWSLEGPSILLLARNGWSVKSLTPGETVRVLMARAKSGEPEGTFVRVTRADGSVLETGRVR